MNLVDAIRMATQQRFQSQMEERLAEPPSTPTLSHAEELDSMQTVRFEVRLTTQQLHDLLQWLARNLHPVMTLREAARYLRLHMAENWNRSPKQALFLRSKWTTSGAF
jgi:hypothetical protein